MGALRAKGDPRIGKQLCGLLAAAGFEQVTASARATAESEMAAIAEAWHRWGSSPGAFFASFWIEATGRVPPEDQR